MDSPELHVCERSRRAAMPVDVLRCRVCESEYPAVANGICAALLRAARAGLRLGRARADRDARADRGGPALALALRSTCCRPRRRRTPRPGPGSRRSSPRRGSRSALGVGEVFLKLDLANPTHSFKDRVVAVAAAKAREFGLDTLSCTSTGNLANAVAARAAASGMRAVIFCPAGLEPEKLLATTVYGGDDLRACAAATTTAPASSASSRARSTGASSTSTCARTTPRARRRSRSRSSSSSAGRRPTRS